MSLPGEQGIVDLPMVLVLCVFIASIGIGLGLKGLRLGGKMKEKQTLVQSFDRLVEKTTLVGYGGVGSGEEIKLDLPDGRIEVEDRLVELKRGEETLRSETLVLPFRRKERENFQIHGGNYLVELVNPTEKDGSFFLRIREL